MNLFSTYWANPYLLLLLPLLLLLYYFRRRGKNTQNSFKISAIVYSKTGFKNILLQMLPLLRFVALCCIVVALARPQRNLGAVTQATQGIDIVLSTDVSSSMLAQDFLPNRLEAAKNVATDFINARSNDRIGLVIFAGESFTLCPLTTDHNVLKELLSSASPGMLQDGTAIGMGLATAVDRLRQAKGKSKVVILLTDGINNAGNIDPQTAAQIAKSFGVKVYAIGMSSGDQRVPFGGGQTYRQAGIDEQLLHNIATETGGKYFRATDETKLQEIYREIDRLEKTKVQSARYQPKQDLFYPWLLAAFIILSAEFLLRFTVLKSVTPA